MCPQRSEDIRSPEFPDVGSRSCTQFLSSPTNIIFVWSLVPRNWLNVLNRELQGHSILRCHSAWELRLGCFEII